MSSTTLFLLQEKKEEEKEKEKERKETKKVKLGSSFSVKKKTKKFEEVGSLFSDVHVVFCCSRRLRTPTIVKSYN